MTLPSGLVWYCVLKVHLQAFHLSPTVSYYKHSRAVISEWIITTRGGRYDEMYNHTIWICCTVYTILCILVTSFLFSYSMNWLSQKQLWELPCVHQMTLNSTDLSANTLYHHVYYVQSCISRRFHPYRPPPNWHPEGTKLTENGRKNILRLSLYISFCMDLADSYLNFRYNQ